MCSSLAADPASTAQLSALGEGGVASFNHAGALLLNPAVVGLQERMMIRTGWSRLYWGVAGDNLGEGFLAFNFAGFSFGNFGLGAAYRYADIQRDLSLKLALGVPLRWEIDGTGLALGVAGELYQRSWAQDEFNVEFAGDPVLLAATSKSAFSLDAGIFWRPSVTWSFGLAGQRLTEPNLAVSNGSAILPRTIRAGAAWQSGIGQLSLDLEAVPSATGERWPVEPQVAWEGSFGQGRLHPRLGCSERFASVGFGYSWASPIEASIDYAVGLPLTQLISVGQIHRLTAGIALAPPRRSRVDLAFRRDRTTLSPARPLAQDYITINAEVINLGGRTARNFQVRLYQSNADGPYLDLNQPKTVEALSAGSFTKVSWRILLMDTLHFKWVVSVDDTGRFLGTIPEYDEENNRDSVTVQVHAAPKLDVTIEPDHLALRRVTTVSADEPFVPMVFFDPNSDKVPQKYNRVLSEISQRMTENPDAKLTIYGYYHEDSDTLWGSKGNALAFARAESVRAKMVDSQPSIDSRVVVARSDYDPARARAERTLETLRWQRGKNWIGHENRRVEMSIELANAPEYTIHLDTLTGQPLPEELDDFRSKVAPTLAKYLGRNSMVDVVVTGLSGAASKESVERAFEYAGQAKKALSDVIGQPGRIHYYASPAVGPRPGTVTFRPSGEPVSHSPIEGDKIISEVSIADSQFARAKIRTSSDLPLDSLHLWLTSDKGEIVRDTLIMNPPESLSWAWNWRTPDGQLVRTDRQYGVRAQVTDDLGQTVKKDAGPMRIDLEDIEKSDELYVAVQFIFADIKSSSKVLESRVEFLANKVLQNLPPSGKRMQVIVSGHTDTTGTVDGNLRLSQERADVELSNLKRYLRFELGLRDSTALEQWLNEKHISMVAKGEGWSDPYRIQRRSPSGETRRQLLGDNQTPEGRAINRRVEVEFKLR